MIRIIIAALFCALFCVPHADAKPVGCIETGDIMRPVCGMALVLPRPSLADRREAARVARGQYIAEKLGYGGVADRRTAVRKVSESAAQRVVYGTPSTPWAATTLVDRARSYISPQVVGGRPAGCPHAFCGCGASLHLFGRIIPSLNLAANWLRFPRVAPAPNMVAARRGHVFVLKEHIAGDTWLAYDANSGGRIRVHARSIAGYQIVNPHGAV